MKPITQSSSDLLKTTKIWESPSTRTTTEQNIFRFYSPVIKPNKDKFTNIDDAIEKFEKNTVKAAALARARIRMAENINSDQLSLAKLRLSKGMSQLQLAKRMGKEQSFIARLERNPSANPNTNTKTTQELAEALDIDPSVVLKAIIKQRKI